jgi:nucleotide-binding universal stress UspA family protein
MIRKILVPTDGSKTALKSVQYAAGLAGQTGAAITLLGVIDKHIRMTQTIPSIATPTHLIEPIEDYLRQVVEAELSKAESICSKNGIRAKRIVRTGHPVEEIIKAAEKTKTDLIVMGSHGKSALKAAVLGSTTFGVIHKDTKIPVLVVRR